MNEIEFFNKYYLKPGSTDHAGKVLTYVIWGHNSGICGEIRKLDTVDGTIFILESTEREGGRVRETRKSFSAILKVALRKL